MLSVNGISWRPVGKVVRQIFRRRLQQSFRRKPCTPCLSPWPIYSLRSSSRGNGFVVCANPVLPTPPGSWPFVPRGEKRSNQRTYMTTMPKVNLAKLRSIPILSVAEQLGIEVMKTGTVYAMKDESGKASSLTISISSNRWKRWSGIEQGGTSGGSVIDLVMHIKNSENLSEAIDWLTSHFPSYS